MESLVDVRNEVPALKSTTLAALKNRARIQNFANSAPFSNGVTLGLRARNPERHYSSTSERVSRASAKAGKPVVACLSDDKIMLWPSIWSTLGCV